MGLIFTYLKDFWSILTLQLKNTQDTHTSQTAPLPDLIASAGFSYAATMPPGSLPAFPALLLPQALHILAKPQQC